MRKPKWGWIVLVLMFVALGGAYVLGQERQERQDREAVQALEEQQIAAAAQGMAPLPGSKLAESLASGRPTLVEFISVTSKPSQEMAPVISRVTYEYRDQVNVVAVSVEVSSDLAAKYRITGTPTLIVFDAKGREVQRRLGVITRAEIDKALAAAGVT